MKDMKKIINILVENQLNPEGIVLAHLRLKFFIKYILLVTIKLTKLFHFLDKKEKIKRIGSKIFTMTVTIMTLATAVIPFMLIKYIFRTLCDSSINFALSYKIHFKTYNFLLYLKTSM